MSERQAIFEQLTDTELRLLDKPAPADKAKASKLSQITGRCSTTSFATTTFTKLCYFVVDMKKANVYNYIKVAEYSAKVQTIGNLQEAYKLIESKLKTIDERYNR